MERPETRYAKTRDGVHIAYQVVGSGPVDLVFVPYDFSNIEANWELPQYRSFASGLAEHARLILLDCRGVGASDRGAGLTPTIEARMDDIRVVMDATGSERACLFGIESGAMLCFPFAATHPERTSGVIVFGATASGRWAPDYPWAWKPEGWQPWLDRIDEARPSSSSCPGGITSGPSTRSSPTSVRSSDRWPTSRRNSSGCSRPCSSPTS